MGTSTSVEQLVAKLSEAGAALQAADRQAVQAASLAMKSSIVPKLAEASGGDLRLSRVGKKGARIGVAFTIAGATNPTAIIKAIGPVPLVESDVPAHSIKPKKRSKARALYFNGRFIASAQHPGTHGKHPWREGVAIGEPLSVAAFREVEQAALLKVFA